MNGPAVDALDGFAVVVALDTGPDDYDGLGHLSNLTTSRLVDDARNAWFGRIEGLQGGCVVRRLELDYEREALPGEALLAGVRATGRGRTSIQLELVLATDSGTVVARARTVQVCFDLATRQAVACWPEFVASIEAVQGAPLPVVGARG